MSGRARLDDETAAELHNRLAKQIVDQIAKDDRGRGHHVGKDVMMLRESVLVGVVLGCLPLGHDVKVLGLIVGRVKEQLARVRHEDLDAKGNG